ncbi:hypothetical protein ACE6H2_015403 [Prunus campanulata]
MAPPPTPKNTLKLALACFAENWSTLPTKFRNSFSSVPNNYLTKLLFMGQ